MTKKGTYEVSDVRPSKDGSFRSMLCAMLVFLSLCGTILLISWLMRPSNSNGIKFEKYPTYSHSSSGNLSKGEITNTIKPVEGTIISSTQGNNKEETTIKPIEDKIETTTHGKKFEKIVQASTIKKENVVESTTPLITTTPKIVIDKRTKPNIKTPTIDSNDIETNIKPTKGKKETPPTKKPDESKQETTTPLLITSKENEEIDIDFKPKTTTEDKEKATTLPNKKLDDPMQKSTTNSQSAVETTTPLTTTQKAGKEVTPKLPTEDADKATTPPVKNPNDPMQKSTTNSQSVVETTTPLTTTQKAGKEVTPKLPTEDADKAKTPPVKNPDDPMQKSTTNSQSVVETTTPLTTTQKAGKEVTPKLPTEDADKAKTPPVKNPDDPMQKSTTNSQSVVKTTTPLTTTQKAGKEVTPKLPTEDADKAKTPPVKNPDDPMQKSTTNSQSVVETTTPLTTTQKAGKEVTPKLPTEDADKAKTPPVKNPDDPMQKSTTNSQSVVETTTPLTTTQKAGKEVTPKLPTEDADKATTPPVKNPNDPMQKSTTNSQSVVETTTPLTTTQKAGKEITPKLSTEDADKATTPPVKNPNDPMQKSTTNSQSVVETTTPLTATQKAGKEVTPKLPTEATTPPVKNPNDPMQKSTTNSQSVVETTMPLTTTQKAGKEITPKLPTEDADKATTPPVKNPNDPMQKFTTNSQSVVETTTPLTTTQKAGKEVTPKLPTEDAGKATTPPVKNPDDPMQKSTTNSQSVVETTTPLTTTPKAKKEVTTELPKITDDTRSYSTREISTTIPESPVAEETRAPLNNKNPLLTTTPKVENPITTADEKKEDTTPKVEITTISSTSTVNEETKPNTPIHFQPPQGESLEPDQYAPTQQSVEFCTSSVCKTYSSQMLAQMNHQVEKCDSFYDYACEGHEMKNSDEKIWTKMSEKLENIDSESLPNLILFRSYYDKCLDHHILCSNDKRIEEAKIILDSIVSPNIPTTNEDKEITKLLATLMLNDYAPLFDITVDISNETKLFQFQLTLGQENTILQDENYVSQAQKKCMLDMKSKIASSDEVNIYSEYMSYLKCKNHVDEYINNVMQTAKYLNLDLINNDIGFASKLTAFLNKFKNLPTPQDQRTIVIMKKYELKSISQLKIDYPLVKWDHLFSQLVNKNVDDSKLVQVYFGTYLKDWFAQLNTLSKQDLYKFLYAMFANNLYRTLVVPSSTSTAETEKLCFKQSSKLLKEVSSSMYLEIINQMDLDLHINEINDIFGQLKKSLSKTLENADWLQEQTSKDLVIQKLQKMTLITNMVVWENQSIINARLADVPSNIQTYQNFSIELVKRYRHMIYNMWNQSADNPEYIWWYYQTVFSEKFVPIYALNTIVISPVKLLEVQNDIPEYIRLAKLFYLLGKAMGHHFDNTGIQYNMDLDLYSAKAYESLENCASYKIKHEQSIDFKGQTLKYQIKGTLPLLSLNNRIAEDIGLKLTYDLSRTHLMTDRKIIWLSSTYNPAELSFVAIAQEHCSKLSVEEVIIQLYENEELPAPILLKTILPNLKTFEEVFECVPGSTMHDQLFCPAFQDLEMFVEKK